MAADFEDDYGDMKRNSYYQSGPARQDLYSCIEDLAKNLSNQEEKSAEIHSIVDRVVRTGKDHLLLKSANMNRKGETILHTAIKLLQFKNDVEKRVLILLVERFPKFMLQDRKNTEYSGQTPLHMAVTKGNVWLVHTLLEYMSNPEQIDRKTSLLRRRATGSIFTNTVMMAEIPISIAALTFNKGMVDLLLQHGAQLDGVNSQGDTLCHSLIRYSFLYPERRDDVLDMCQYISDDPLPYDTSVRASRLRKLRAKVWVMENGSGQNPLQLAALLGQHAIFTFIMNTTGYCHNNANDGLFDIKIYDVTDIDAISTMKDSEIRGQDNTKGKLQEFAEDVPDHGFNHQQRPLFRRSVLQMLMEVDPATSFQFILFPPLRRIIDQKWNRYRKYFYPWWLLHTAFMACLTWYAIERSKQNASTSINEAPSYSDKIFQGLFLTVYGIASVVVAGLYILQVPIMGIKGKLPWTLYSFTNPYGNGAFRIMFILMSLCLVVDFVCAIFAPLYEMYCLYGAILLGWFLTLFFLRALRPFSFFTVLIQNVMVGDMLRFGVVLAFELVAFTTCIFMSMQASANNDNTYEDFSKIMLSLFQLMFGLGDFDELLTARKPFVTVTLFVLFIVLTTVLMINSLIAMMSYTCTELVTNVGNISAKDMHWRLQRLSVVLYIESLLPNWMVYHVGDPNSVLHYNNAINQRTMMTRYQLEVRSLQNDVDDPEEEVAAWDWGFRTAVFNALGNKLMRTSNVSEDAEKKERPWSGAMDKMKNYAKKRMGKKSTKAQTTGSMEEDTEER